MTEAGWTKWKRRTKSTWVTKKCLECAKPFLVPRCHAARVHRCSMKCKRLASRGNGIEYKGAWYSLSKSHGYYIQAGGNGLLHRVIWRDTFGPIPNGYDVHHKNGIKTDNRPENLELMHHIEHISHHTKERHARNRKMVNR